jgi:NTE family protein
MSPGLSTPTVRIVTRSSVALRLPEPRCAWERLCRRVRPIGETDCFDERIALKGESELSFDLEALVRAAEPVHDSSIHPEEKKPAAGVALCLSGGGYRAMLFHLGALMRLNELGYIPQLDRVSSVSGGSISAGVLASRWSRLRFTRSGVAENFDALVLSPLRAMAARTIDIPSVLLGLFGLGTAGGRLAGAYRRHLFADATLQDLPDRPRFVFNATNLQSGALWRFSKPYMWDYQVGEVAQPTVPLGVVVAASSAFPPFLSPVRLRVPESNYTPATGNRLQMAPYTSEVFLSDGGVYDNLGLETAWKSCQTVLISDGGAGFKFAPRPRVDWLLQSYRVLSVIDHQVRSLRKRQAIDSFKAGMRQGTYWGVGTHIADYGLASALPCPSAQTELLAATPTRLGSLDTLLQKRLINWGYAVCDAAMRTHVDSSHPAPTSFPYEDAGVG